ncbi:MAG TPA: AAA family ATPase, partial [Dehalococcoidia bacterium]
MPANRTPFVGRRRELTALLSHLEVAAAGHGGVMLVAGEPGLGKTRLLGEQAARTGWLVLSGRAYDGEGLPPYLLFTEALRGYVRTCTNDELQEWLGRAAAEVALLVPEVCERLPDLTQGPSLSPEHERYRLFESVCDVLIALAHGRESSGLLLLLDDLHWADKPSLLLLQHLARRVTGARLLVVGAFRREDLGNEHPLLDLLATLRREELGEPLELAALLDDETALLVAQIAAVEPNAEVAAAIQRRVEGNPFFVGEVVRHLQAEGFDLADARVATAGRGLPAGVREVIGRRLARLGAEASAALQAGAVLGDGLTFAELRETCGLPEELLLDALDLVLSAGLLREAGAGYQFGHALIRETVYAALSLPRRERLHRRAAEAIERLYAANLKPHVAALAGHWRLAGSTGDAEKALAYAQQAAEAASSVFAWEDAAQHLQTRLKLLGSRGRGATTGYCDALLALGDAQWRAGNRRAAQLIFEEVMAIAKAIGAASRFAQAALGFAGKWSDGETDARSRDLIEESLTLMPAGDSALRAALLARLGVVTFNLHESPG